MIHHFHEVGHRLGSSSAEPERTVLRLSDPGSLPERATLVRQGDPAFLGKISLEKEGASKERGTKLWPCADFMKTVRTYRKRKKVSPRRTFGIL